MVHSRVVLENIMTPDVDLTGTGMDVLFLISIFTGWRNCTPVVLS